MLKRLAITILFAIVLPIHGQEKGSQSSGNQNNSNGPQNVTAAPPRTVTCVVKQEGTAIECKWPKDVPESKLRRLFSPENAPNIGLFFVGLGGVLAAVFTLSAINKQAKLMEVQAGHMKTQSEHMETQLKDARSALKKTLVLQFRPKLIIRGGIIVDKEVTLWVTNMGGTPAHIVRAMISIMLTSAKYEDVLKGVDETIPTGTTFAGGESRLVTIPITEEIGNVLNPVPAQSPTGSPLSKPVLLAGFIRYRDDLGIVRNTGLWRRSKGNLFVVDPDSDWDYSD